MTIPPQAGKTLELPIVLNEISGVVTTVPSPLRSPREKVPSPVPTIMCWL